MKAILIIDLPKMCKECPLWVHTYYTDWGRTSTTEECCLKKKKEDCPLKPMPTKKNEEIVIKGHTGEIAEAYQDGWNDCLKEIADESDIGD